MSAYSLNKTPGNVVASGTCKISISSEHVSWEFRFYTGDRIYRQTASRKESESASSRVPCVVKAHATGGGREEQSAWWGAGREGSRGRGLEEACGWRGEWELEMAASVFRRRGSRSREPGDRLGSKQLLQVEGFLLILQMFI